MVLVISAVLVAYFIHRPIHPIYRFMNAMLICVFAHFMYENIFTFFYRLSGYGIDTGTLPWIKVYWAITILLTSGILYSNKKFNFISLKHKYEMATMMLVLINCFIKMYQTGWYIDLYSWFHGGPDPHNFVWAMSKAIGFYIWIPLVKYDQEVEK